MKAFTVASHFCTVSFFNCWANCVIYFVSCVFVYRSMCSIYSIVVLLRLHSFLRYHSVFSFALNFIQHFFEQNICILSFPWMNFFLEKNNILFLFFYIWMCTMSCLWLQVWLAYRLIPVIIWALYNFLYPFPSFFVDF